MDKLVRDNMLTELTAKYPSYVGESKDSDETDFNHSGAFTSGTLGNSAEWVARAMDAKG